MQNHQLENQAVPPDSEPLDANQQSAVRTSLSIHRTVMAADRSLMAWVRTGLSMISFGFTIYKVLEGFQESGSVQPDGLSPKNAGLVLIGLGSLSIITGTIEYWNRLGGMGSNQHIKRITPAFIMAMVWSALGIAAFFGIINRVL